MFSIQLMTPKKGGLTIKRVRTPEQLKALTIAQRVRRQANPERYREIGRKSEHRRRLKRYGVTEEWYTNKLKEQRNCCAICLDQLIPGRQTHIDHNHTTGAVREILCHYCNLLIGNAREDTLVLRQAINYLEKHDLCDIFIYQTAK